MKASRAGTGKSSRTNQARTGNKTRRTNSFDAKIRRVELVCAIALTIAIVVLHIHRASHAGPLWRDEIGTFDMGTFPSLHQTWSLLASESFPLLIYMVVRGWALPGWHAVDMSLRVLGAVIGVGSLLALWSAKRLVDHRVPILSLALFGLNATVISWGDSLRAYGLGVLLILLVYGSIWRVAVSSTPKRMALAAAASILSVQCLYQNSLLVFAICVGGCLVCLRHRMWKGILSILAIGGAAALSLLPYIPTMIRAQQAGSLVQSDFGFTHLLKIFAAALGSDVLLWAWLIGGGCCVAVGFAFIVFRQMRDRSEPGHGDLAIFSATIMILGTVLFFLFLKGTQLTTETWYYIVILGTIALSIDISVELLAAPPLVKILRIAVSLLVAAVAIPLAWNQASLRQTNIDFIAEQLGKQGSREDFVVVIPWYYGVTFQNYYRGDTRWSTAPPIQDLKVTRYDLLKEQMTLDRPLQPVFESIERSLKAGARVWIVGDLVAPREGQLPPSLPIAPNGPHGWYSGDYLGVWNLELGYFIKLHSVSAQRVNMQLDQPVNPYEQAPVLLFSGWRP